MKRRLLPPQRTIPQSRSNQLKRMTCHQLHMTCHLRWRCDDGSRPGVWVKWSTWVILFSKFFILEHARSSHRNLYRPIYIYIYYILYCCYYYYSAWTYIPGTYYYISFDSAWCKKVPFGDIIDVPSPMRKWSPNIWGRKGFQAETSVYFSKNSTCKNA